MGIKNFINKVRFSKQLTSVPQGFSMSAVQAIAQKIIASLEPSDRDEFVVLVKSQNIDAILSFIKEKNINLEVLISEKMSKASN